MPSYPELYHTAPGNSGKLGRWTREPVRTVEDRVISPPPSPEAWSARLHSSSSGTCAVTCSRSAPPHSPQGRFAGAPAEAVAGQAANALRASSWGKYGETEDKDRSRYCREAAHE